ncbi:MAG: putative zinc-binding peptidase [Acidocella sp.]|nr:putative zinc-binding peptidase [Acidocella sp.]
MKLFKCQVCDQTVFFENSRCEQCSNTLGYLPATGQMLTITGDGTIFQPVRGRKMRLRACANATNGACNWLIPAKSNDLFCTACRHNHTIPDLAIGNHLALWQQVEAARHRLIYTLLALGVPLFTRAEDPEHGLAFDVLADPPAPGPRILTGHENGLITINLAEADSAQREQARTIMGEPYRTLLGHFRHESGHYAWDVLLRDPDRLAAARALFGDDTQDYAAALARHYEQGPSPDWRNAYISAYATAHPWEDFAETWAHYLHIVDTLETASAFGLRIHPTSTKNRTLHADIDFDPHHAPSIHRLIAAWLPLTFAINSLNRSLGQPDSYPFVVSNPVIEKLGFIHDLLKRKNTEPARATSSPELVI